MKLVERASYAPVLCRLVFSRISPVDFEVRLSSIVAVEFLISVILSWLGHGRTVTFPSVHVFSSIHSGVYRSLYMTPTGSLWHYPGLVGFTIVLT